MQVTETTYPTDEDTELVMENAYTQEISVVKGLPIRILHIMPNVKDNRITPSNKNKGVAERHV